MLLVQNRCQMGSIGVYTSTSRGLANADPSVAPEPNFIGPPSLIWGDADVLCAGPRERRKALNIGC